MAYCETVRLLQTEELFGMCVIARVYAKFRVRKLPSYRDELNIIFVCTLYSNGQFHIGQRADCAGRVKAAVGCTTVLFLKRSVPFKQLGCRCVSFRIMSAMKLSK